MGVTLTASRPFSFTSQYALDSLFSGYAFAWRWPVSQPAQRLAENNKTAVKKRKRRVPRGLGQLKRLTRSPPLTQLSRVKRAATRAGFQ
jgi:hypothetical protein